jgi:hypothetical protein
MTDKGVLYSKIHTKMLVLYSQKRGFSLAKMYASFSLSFAKTSVRSLMISGKILQWKWRLQKIVASFVHITEQKSNQLL